MAVSPANDILKNPTVLYTITNNTTNKITYVPSIGEIIHDLSVSTGGMSMMIVLYDGTTEKKTINSNGYVTWTGTLTSSLKIKMQIVIQGVTRLDSVLTFNNIPTNQNISLSCNVEGITTSGNTSMFKITHLVLVTGSTAYTWEQIYSPIATVGNACDKAIVTTLSDRTKVLVYSSSNKNSETVNASGNNVCFALTAYPSETYLDKQAIRYADLSGELGTK